MKKLFRFTAAATALAFSAALFACSGKNNSKPVNDNPSQPSAVVQDSTVSTDGYESPKYNLRFTPPEDYIMYIDAETSANPSDASHTKHEMSSGHSSGFPFVTVMVEQSDAASVDEFLGSMSFELSPDSAALPDITDCEIAGRTFRHFTVPSSEPANSIYAEKNDDGYLYISVLTIGNTPHDEVISAFSEF